MEGNAWSCGSARYFQAIQERASKRWDQLEADPELAGPWHQLFKQVQSPRHILSELLQNADDAGASEARVSIENDRFVFEHNGEDFIEAHFASICRFGYSNKRALHTIGFRGIGFKSTFSLGDRVELFTPTLAVAFERTRFTQPHWIDSRDLTSGTTRVEVAIANPLLRRDVEKNLDEWLKSPVSLLFFRKIRRLRIGDSEVHWQSLGPGPIAESEWMALDEKADNSFLLVRSPEEAFSADALDEIRKERMLGAEDSGDFPPCRVEIVSGREGKALRRAADWGRNGASLRLQRPLHPGSGASQDQGSGDLANKSLASEADRRTRRQRDDGVARADQDQRAGSG